MNSNPPSPLSRLRVRWMAVAALYAFTTLTGYGLLRGWIGIDYANQWLGQTAVFLIYTLTIIAQHLPENHRMGDVNILPTFGLGNQLTIMRGLLISMLAGFLFIPWVVGWLPALLYTTADIADFFDGFAARKTNHVTALGARLDMEFDGLGMLLVSLLAVWYGQLPFYYLFIGLGRYFFIVGLWLRAKWGLQNHTMPPSTHRRIVAGLQMGFMSVVLWPILPAAAATIAGTIFGLATVASFLRDWLVVIGWLDPSSPRYQRRQRQLYRLFSTQLPPLFRLIFATCALLLISNMPVGWAALFTSWHLPFPSFWVIFFAITSAIAAIAIVAGAMGRVMALWLLFSLGFDISINGANGINGTALACVILITLLGTGAYALWQPEKQFLYRRAGE